MTGGTNIRPHLTIVKKQLLHTLGLRMTGTKLIVKFVTVISY